MSQARSTFPYDDDREVIAHFLAGVRKPRHSIVSPLEAAAGLLRWGGNIEKLRPAGVTVAWFNLTDGALVGRLLVGADYYPGVLLVHAITNALGAPELRVVRESSSLEVKASARRSAPTIGIAPDAERHRFFFASNPIQIDQPFLIAGPMAITAYRAALKPKSEP